MVDFQASRSWLPEGIVCKYVGFFFFVLLHDLNNKTSDSIQTLQPSGHFKDKAREFIRKKTQVWPAEKTHATQIVAKLSKIRDVVLTNTHTGKLID